MGKRSILVHLAVCPNKVCPILGTCKRLNLQEIEKNTVLSPQIKKAIVLLFNNYQNGHYHIKNLAEDMGIGIRHLERVFKMELGCSPNHCLMQFRLNKFVELMYKGNYSVKEAWIEAGFNSWDVFEHLRKKRIKVSIKDVK